MCLRASVTLHIRNWQKNIYDFAWPKSHFSPTERANESIFKWNSNIVGAPIAFQTMPVCLYSTLDFIHECVCFVAQIQIWNWHKAAFSSKVENLLFARNHRNNHFMVPFYNSNLIFKWIFKSIYKTTRNHQCLYWGNWMHL